MEKKKTYQELLKEYTMTQNKKESETFEWQTELFLTGLLQERHMKALRAGIDQALDDRDKETFIRLSGELNELMEVVK